MWFTQTTAWLSLFFVSHQFQVFRLLAFCYLMQSSSRLRANERKRASMHSRAMPRACLQGQNHSRCVAVRATVADATCVTRDTARSLTATAYRVSNRTASNLCFLWIRRKQSRRQSKHLKLTPLSAVTVAAEDTEQATALQTLPDVLQKCVAHLSLQAQRGSVQIYILGASHVSQRTCKHIVQLISAIKPDVALLELCKDRVDLLISPSTPVPQHWHSRVINFQSSFTQQASSVASACQHLLSGLRCQPGKAFSAYDIEQDCIQLLSSGLFASVQPVTQPASVSDAPMFVCTGSQVRDALLVCFHSFACSKASACAYADAHQAQLVSVVCPSACQHLHVFRHHHLHECGTSAILTVIW